MPAAASAVRLTFACGLYDRMVPLYTGDVRPEGIDLDFLAIDSPREIFDRMAGAQAFDASEMSISEMITRISARQCPFVAIPAFPSRCFRHGFITVNRRAVRAPKDLEGKRIGVALYTQTAAVFMRGLLAEDYGVDFSGVRWVEGAINQAAPHGRPTVLPVLRQVPITANDTGRSLSDLLAAGEIDAILGTSLPASIRTSPDVVRLFPDFREREKDYYRRTRIFPIMHTVAIRRDVVKYHRRSCLIGPPSAKLRSVTSCTVSPLCTPRERKLFVLSPCQLSRIPPANACPLVRLPPSLGTMLILRPPADTSAPPPLVE